MRNDSKKNVKSKKIGLFCTHGAPEETPFLPPWLDKIRKAAEDSGAEIVGFFNCQSGLSQKVADAMAKSGRPDLERFAQYHHMTRGQPDKSRVEKAREFAREIMTKIS